MRPALDWLRAVWAAVSGGAAPPADARVVLADDHRVWCPPSQHEHSLWERLRAAYLEAVWALRCARSMADPPKQFTPTAVQAIVVRTIRRAVRWDWARSTQDVKRLGIGGSRQFRGREPALMVPAMEDRWCVGQLPLVRVHEEELDIRFSADWPVPVVGVAAAARGASTGGERADGAGPGVGAAELAGVRTAEGPVGLGWPGRGSAAGAISVPPGQEGARGEREAGGLRGPRVWDPGEDALEAESLGFVR